MTKERPILFNAEMVRAILAGQKTQTRRVAKEFDGKGNIDAVLARFPHQSGCPCGQPGDQMWVRETFGHRWHPSQPPYFHRASDEAAIGNHPDFDGWRPSTQMPREACRLLLEITAVRVERLQKLPEADWEAEGISFCMEDPSTAAGHAFSEAEHYAIAGVSMRGTPEDHGMRAQFAEQGLDWDANPWVWVIDFKQVAV